MASREVSPQIDSKPATIFAQRDASLNTSYPVLVDTNGNLKVIDIGKLVPVDFSEVYLTVSQGTSALTTAVNYSDGSTTVATLTLTYDANEELTKVVRS